MGLKKYEIITVGSDKRVRALRSWQVGDRYVNIGDVGGIVYDEKTLSQDGACWLFKGNFGFPGARIGGNSIVDVGETTLSTAGTPAVDILGSSVLVGGPLRFVSGLTSADAVVLTAADFEQGTINYVQGGNYESMKAPHSNFIRSKRPIFLGDAGVTLKCDVPGYEVQAVTLDRDGNGVTTSNPKQTREGATLVVPTGQYMVIRLAKTPGEAIVPADATAAQITFTGVYETGLSVIDSRLEVGPVNSTGVATVSPGGTTPRAPYPESIIRNARVSINIPNANRNIRIMGQIIGSNATINATGGDAQLVGIYSNVKNIVASGVLSTGLSGSVHYSIQATDCDNFVVSPTIFPGYAASQIANTPFIFQGCNIPNGKFYHHAQIANTYNNIDFAKASADLGKATASGGVILVSSEVEGMYRAAHRDTGAFGALVESYESVKGLSVLNNNPSSSYGTTIYKDAYLKGLFQIEGTNVFGNKVRSHPLAQVLNVQPRAVQGKLALTVGQRPTLVPGSSARVVIDRPIRINTANGIMVSNIPAGIQVAFACVDGQGNYEVVSTWKEGTATVTNLAQLDLPAAYLMFKKANDSPITTEEIAGATITVYNGCKIVNTGTSVVNMKGNIRVEDNATLVNASVTGSGYFGGNSVVYYNPTVWAALGFNGTVYMKDDTVFAPSALTGENALVHMEGNAKFTGSVDVSTNLSFIMRDNAVIEGKVNTRSGVVMSGNSKVTATGQIMAGSRGVLVMEENASIEANTTVVGAITLSGNYKGNVVKTWTGKRTITDVNAPEYDNNVKTQYDF